jgi:hypothetical protein
MARHWFYSFGKPASLVSQTGLTGFALWAVEKGF